MKLTKKQQAINLIKAAALAGKSTEEAGREVQKALNLFVYCEAPLTPNTAGTAYYNSHTRTQKQALFEFWAVNGKGKATRFLGREFIAGFTR